MLSMFTTALWVGLMVWIRKHLNIYDSFEKQELVVTIVCFYVDVVVNNAFQLYCLRKPDAGKPKLNALEFRKAIVEAYYL